MEALPALIHRIARVAALEGRLLVSPPVRVKSGFFLNDEDYFRKQIALASAKAAQEDGTVLILLDCEDDCPGTLGPDLLRRAQAVRADIEIIVALAHREFETWFMAAVRSLRGRRGLPHHLDPPPAPHGIRDAKGWLGPSIASTSGFEVSWETALPLEAGLAAITCGGPNPPGPAL